MKRKRNVWAYSYLRCFFTSFQFIPQLLVYSAFLFYQGQSSYFPVKLSISSMLPSRFYIRVLQSGPFLVFQVSVWGSLPLSLLMCFSTFFSYLSFLEIQLFSHILIQLLVNCFSGPWFIKFQLFFFFLQLILLYIFLWLNLLLFNQLVKLNP